MKICSAAYLLTFSVVLMNYSSCQLTSIMAVRSNEDFVRDIRDVPRFSELRIVVEYKTTTAQMFNVSPFHVAKFRRSNES